MHSGARDGPSFWVQLVVVPASFPSRSVLAHLHPYSSVRPLRSSSSTQPHWTWSDLEHEFFIYLFIFISFLFSGVVGLLTTSFDPDPSTVIAPPRSFRSAPPRSFPVASPHRTAPFLLRYRTAPLLFVATAFCRRCSLLLLLFVAAAFCSFFIIDFIFILFYFYWFILFMLIPSDVF